MSTISPCGLSLKRGPEKWMIDQTERLGAASKKANPSRDVVSTIPYNPKDRIEP
jgi:hypothetical protein